MLTRTVIWRSLRSAGKSDLSIVIRHNDPFTWLTLRETMRKQHDCGFLC